MSGWTPGAISWSTARTSSTVDAVGAHDRDRVVHQLAVFDRSGDRFSVQLTKSARRSQKSRSSGTVGGSFDCFAVRPGRGGRARRSDGWRSSWPPSSSSYPTSWWSSWPPSWPVLFAAFLPRGLVAFSAALPPARRLPLSPRPYLASATLPRNASIRSTTCRGAGSSVGATTSWPATLASMTSSSAPRYSSENSSGSKSPDRP